MQKNSATSSPDVNKLLAGVLILAGGQSTRMGSPKALLTLPTDETLLEYHVNAAKNLGKPILIADNQQQFTVRRGATNKQDANKQGVDDDLIQYIQDYSPAKSTLPNNKAISNNDYDRINQASGEKSVGPLGAILSGLLQISECVATSNTTSTVSTGQKQWLLVVSCDSLVNAQDIRKLLADSQNIIELQNNKATSASVICLTDNNNLYPLLGAYCVDTSDALQAYIDSGQRRVMRFIEPMCQSVQIPKAWRYLSNLNTPEQFQNAVASYGKLNL